MNDKLVAVSINDILDTHDSIKKIYINKENLTIAYVCVCVVVIIIMYILLHFL